MAELEDPDGGMGKVEEMEAKMRAVGINTKWVRLVAKTGKLTNVCKMDGASLYATLDTWHKADGITSVFEESVGRVIRRALAALTDVLYAMQSETMSDEHWAVLALDCSELGQLLVGAFGKSLITPTMHEVCAHGGQVLYQLRLVNDLLGLRGKSRLTMKHTGEWAFEEGNKVLRNAITHSSGGGIFGRLGDKSITDAKGSDIIVALGIVLEVVLAEYRDFAIRELTPSRSTEGLITRRDLVAAAALKESLEGIDPRIAKKVTARGYAEQHSNKLYGLGWQKNYGLPAPGRDWTADTAHPLASAHERPRPNDQVPGEEEDPLSDADNPSTAGGVEDSNDASAGVSARRRLLDDLEEAASDDETSDDILLLDTTGAPAPMDKTTALVRHAAGDRPSPAQCSCAEATVGGRACGLVKVARALKVNFKKGRLMLYGNLPGDGKPDRALRQIAFSNIRAATLDIDSATLTVCASTKPFFWKRE